MKWIILLVFVFALLGLIALRYRQQIQTARYVWRMFKQMRQVGKAEEKKFAKKETTNTVELVRCAKCGNWIPRDNALKLRSKTFFCSAKCMEKAVEV